MKNQFLLSVLCLLSLFLFTSCEKEDDCTPGLLESVIVGEWSVTDGGFISGNVEFHADGTFADENEALVFNTIGATDVIEFTYVVDSHSQLRIRADIGTDIIDYIVQIFSFDCDEVELSITGLEYTLKRR